jgi:hypothetical protein
VFVQQKEVFNARTSGVKDVAGRGVNDLDGSAAHAGLWYVEPAITGTGCSSIGGDRFKEK